MGITRRTLLGLLGAAGLASTTNDGGSDMTDRIGGRGGAFEDRDGDDVAELQEDHTDHQGGDARGVGRLGAETMQLQQSRSATVIAANTGGWAVHGINNPQAIHVPERAETYVVYRGESADPFATVYDHAKRAFGGTIRIGTNQLPDDDTHGTPALAIDDAGHLHVFYGAHDDAFQYAKSTNPYDVHSWDDLGPLDSVPVGTYAIPQVYNGDLYVLYRAGGNASGGAYPAHDYAALIRSTDGGQSWTDLGPIIDATDTPESHTDAYVQDLTAVAGRLHFTWTLARGPEHDSPRTNIYHAYYDPDAGTCHGLDGTDYGGTITWAEMDGSVIEGWTGETKIAKQAVDGENVHILHNYKNSVDDRIEKRHTWWDGAAWNAERIAGQEVAATFGASAPRFNGNGELEAHITTNPTSTASEGHPEANYDVFVKRNGSWVRDATIATESELPITHLQTVQNGTDEFPAVACPTTDTGKFDSAVLGVGELAANKTAAAAVSAARRPAPIQAHGPVVEPPQITATAYEDAFGLSGGLVPGKGPSGTLHGRFRTRMSYSNPASAGDQAYLRPHLNGTATSDVYLTELELTTDATGFQNLDSGWVEITSVAWKDLYDSIMVQGKVDSGSMSFSGRNIGLFFDWR